MSSSSFLVPPSKDPSQEKLWVETWKRIDRFLPDLRKELDLDAPREVEKEKVVETEGEKETTLSERPNEEVPAEAE